MMRRRRNKLVLWEWSRDGKYEDRPRETDPARIGWTALGAVLLLGGIIFILTLLPLESDGYYRRGQLAKYMCQVAGVERGSIACWVTSVGGWFLIVVTIGVVLKFGRLALKGIRGD